MDRAARADLAGCCGGSDRCGDRARRTSSPRRRRRRSRWRARVAMLTDGKNIRRLPSGTARPGRGGRISSSGSATASPAPSMLQRPPPASIERLLAGYRISLLSHPCWRTRICLRLCLSSRWSRPCTPIDLESREVPFPIAPLPHVMVWSTTRSRDPAMNWLRDRLRPIVKRNFAGS